MTFHPSKWLFTSIFIIYLSCYIAHKEQIEKVEEKERLVKEKEAMMKMDVEGKSDDEQKESSSSTTLDSENNGLSDEPSADQVSECDAF